MDPLDIVLELVTRPQVERRCIKEQAGKAMHLWRLTAKHPASGDGQSMIAVYAYRFGTDSALGKAVPGALYKATLELDESVPSLLLLRGGLKDLGHKESAP